jgi:hypothetical protein
MALGHFPHRVGAWMREKLPGNSSYRLRLSPNMPVFSRSMSYLAVQHLWSGILLLIDEQSAVKVFGLYKLDIYLVFLDGFLEEEGLSVGMRFQRVAIGYILKGSSPCNLKT